MKQPGHEETDFTYAEVLTDEEVLALPITIKYSGPPTDFTCDEEVFIKRFGKIITDFNKMQEPRFQSFPIGN